MSHRFVHSIIEKRSNLTNPIFAGFCNEAYDGFVIRNSPFQAFFGVDGILIWVIKHYMTSLIFVQKTNFGVFLCLGLR